MQLVQLDRKVQRNVLLTFFGFFAGPIAIALVLAVLNSKHGSLHTHPRDILWVMTALLMAMHALALNTCLYRAGIVSEVHKKGRRIVVAVSTLVAMPIYGLLVSPGVNGLGTQTPYSQTFQVARVENNVVPKSTRRHYYAVVNYPAESSGRYFLGTYGKGWQPGDGGLQPGDIRYVDVVYAQGLLGARVILKATPAR